MTFLESMETELNKYKELLIMVKKRLKAVPYGRLRISNTPSGFTYYLLEEKGKSEVGDIASKDGKYLQKKDEPLIRSLAQKDYDLHVQKLLEMRIRKLEAVIKHYREADFILDYENMKEGRKILIEPVIPGNDEIIAAWENEKYEGKPFYGTDSERTTDKGERVRSKSEMLLANRFAKLGIPYHYEKPIVIKGFGNVYPDFTLLNVRTRKVYIWEHFGQMDDLSYAENTVKKINQYIRNGYIPGENFLMTMETLKTPLDMKAVDVQIKQFLL